MHHIILVLRLKVSKSPRAGMPEGQSLYLLKLGPGAQFITKGYDWGTGQMEEMHWARDGERAQSFRALLGVYPHRHMFTR